eukprot:TRINITY_DN37416_c0_g1_i1.p2 TRINITY_DN37416_c0_g1~~TRINITY_DN37416_c0_g1_i1.p2  ORF type:complete len:413 (+),score=130.44 TRINITY_DN37416_c0_g1_i1:68-1240(+)
MAAAALGSSPLGGRGAAAAAVCGAAGFIAGSLLTPLAPPAGCPPPAPCRCTERGASPAAPVRCPTSIADAQGRPWDAGGEWGPIAAALTEGRLGTDKLEPHHYEPLYAKYLDGLRRSGRHIAMLEIGLGCWFRSVQSRHPRTHRPVTVHQLLEARPVGFSVELWRRYFPSLTYWLVEVFQPCIKGWRQTVGSRGWNATPGAARWYEETMRKRTFWGDQSDPAFLNNVRRAVRGGSDNHLDLIIDDGGHTMDQQITSFERLFPLVRPGGLYIIEDLETSFRHDMGGTAARQRAGNTTLQYLQRIVTDISLPWGLGPHAAGQQPHGVLKRHRPTKWSHWVLSVDCQRQMCVVTKRQRPVTDYPWAQYSGRWPCNMTRCWREPLQKHAVCNCQ